jgi:predicted phage terminase large subunit-like protein
VSIATAYAETSLQAELQRVDTLLAQRSLYEFVKQAWRVVDPGHPFVDNWHLRLICDKLEAVTRREIKRLIINVPPRSGKSSVVCALWPVWTWLQDPTHQWLTISHSGTFATRDALKSRRLLQSPWFQQRWGHLFKLTGDQNQKTRYENDRRGYRIALGITAGITGEGGDTILLDDPMDRDAAHSELERERANVTYDEAISTRLNDPATGAIVVIMQRLHEADTTGHLLDGEESWEHVCLPMLYEPDHPHVCADDERTEADELLWPDRFTPEVVAAAKGKGSYFFAGQYQQLPSPVGGGIWREELLQDFELADGSVITPRGRMPRNDLHVFNVADLAYSSKQTADYTVVGTFGGHRETGALYMLDLFRARIDVLNSAEGREHRLYIRQCRDRHRAEYTIVEEAGLASRVIDLARKDGEPLRGVKADRDKVARSYAAIPLAEARNLYVPRNAPWWPLLWQELAAFPNGAHDDQADVLAYACIWWRDMQTSVWYV